MRGVLSYFFCGDLLCSYRKFIYISLVFSEYLLRDENVEL